MLMPLLERSGTGAQNSRTVTTASGIAAMRMNGIRLPFGFLLRSLSDAMSGSVTASNTRESAVMRPSTVRMPAMTRPDGMNWIAPSFKSPDVGR